MYNKFISFLENKMAPIAGALQNNRYLQAIQNALMTCLSIMMIGSFALILWEPPIDYTTLEASGVFYTFFKAWANFATWADPVLNLIYTFTMGSLSFYVAISITYYLAKHYKMNTLLPIVVTIVSFFMLNSLLIEGGLSNEFFGGTGLFASIVVSIASCEFYRLLINRKIGMIKMPDSVPNALSNTFNSLFPITIVAIVIAAISTLITYISGITFPEMVLLALTPLVRAVDNLFSTTFLIVLQQILWWFGIHDLALGSVLEPIRIANQAANTAAYTAGTSLTQLPHILTTPYWFVFLNIGGTASTFGLCILLMKSKAKRFRTIGKLGIVPAFFNINEPVMFGIPMILNPFWLLPYVGTATLNGVVTYLCMMFGIVNRTALEVGWNLFFPVGAYLSTLDVRAVILIIILAIVDTLIYYPFFKIEEKRYLEEETACTEEVQ